METSFTNRRKPPFPSRNPARTLIGSIRKIGLASVPNIASFPTLERSPRVTTRSPSLSTSKASVPFTNGAKKKVTLAPITTSTTRPSPFWNFRVPSLRPIRTSLIRPTARPRCAKRSPAPPITTTRRLTSSRTASPSRLSTVKNSPSSTDGSSRRLTSFTKTAFSTTSTTATNSSSTASRSSIIRDSTADTSLMPTVRKPISPPEKSLIPTVRKRASNSRRTSTSTMSTAILSTSRKVRVIPTTS